MMARRNVLPKVARVLLVFMLVYLVIGLGFHFTWKSALEACREARLARGEFVEPEVLGDGIGLFFDLTYWPVYTWANLHHFGTPFSTPCG